MTRLAIIVSHPIQYYVPLYERLAARGDLTLRVFFTWHDGDEAVFDHGFRKNMQWDVPLIEGYPFQKIPNTSRDPGTHSFWGLKNPTLISTVLEWDPDAVLLTGYPYASHLKALYSLYRKKVPVLCRGDSHLLNQKAGISWLVKRIVLRQVYRWSAACLYVGTHNKNYYRAFDVPEHRLFPCGHSIQVNRFAEPHVKLESEAAVWRKNLGIGENRIVLLFAGKFEKKKRPLDLLNAIRQHHDSRIMLILVGDGELGNQLRCMASSSTERIRILPFQNQSRMPVVYRLGDLLVLPSAFNETWGLAVNEALACGRPVLVSDRVGCAPELVIPGYTGETFRADDWADFKVKLSSALQWTTTVDRQELRRFAESFDIETTEAQLMNALAEVIQNRCVKDKAA